MDSRCFSQVHSSQPRVLLQRNHTFHNDEEPTSLSSDPGWQPQYSTPRVNGHSGSCQNRRNYESDTKKFSKSVTFSELPQSFSTPKPNYVNIDFAESLKFYENCRDCSSSGVKDLYENVSSSFIGRENGVCKTCQDNRTFGICTKYSDSKANQIENEIPGYIKMTSLAKSMNSKKVDTLASDENNTCPTLLPRPKSKSSLCLVSSQVVEVGVRVRSTSDPEIYISATNRVRAKAVLSRLVDFGISLLPDPAQRGQTSKRSSLPLCKNRLEESNFQSDDTLSSATMVNTTNGGSVRGSLNSVCSENAQHMVVNRFMSTSQLNICLASIEDFKSADSADLEINMEKYKEHLRSLELPNLPLDPEYLRSDSSGVRRSCTLTFKPGHNRDSSSSNDSGVSTASLRLRRTDFTEFEMPVTTALSAKLLREYALSQAGKSSSDMSLPKRSKSIDPLGELVFQFQDSTSSAKSTSALLSAVEGKGKLFNLILLTVL